MRPALAFALLAAFPLSAAAAEAPRWTVGVAGGQSRTGSELVENRESTIVRATDIHSDFDRTDSAWKAFAAWRLNDYLAFEAGYADLGRHTLTTDMLGGDAPAPATIITRRRVKGYGIDAVLGTPIAGRFAVFARFGAYRTRLEAEAELQGNIEFTNGAPGENVRTTRRDDTVAHYGAGASWDVTPQLALRLEWERFADIGKAFEIGGTGTTGRADTDLYTVGVAWRF